MQTRNKEELPTPNKERLQKPTANITRSYERLNVFSLSLGKRHGCLFSPLLLSVRLDILASATRQEREIRGAHIGKKEMA